MKVYISKYRDHWISPYTIIDYAFFWTDWSKCSRHKGYMPDSEYVSYPAWVNKWADRLEPVSRALQKFLDFVHPEINYVHIDRWDTWSMDHTLSYMIVPMLRQLKKDKHGAPCVDDEDVPEHLRSTSAPPKENSWDTDDNFFKRWDWVMDEMIWAFEQKVNSNSDDQFYDHSESRLEPDLNKSIRKLKIDQAGLDAWQQRKTNGYRLFGKYYEGLWD